MTVLLVAMIPTNELDDRFVEYFDESITFRTDTDFTAENLTGIYQIEFSLGSGGSGAISRLDRRIRILNHCEVRPLGRITLRHIHAL